MAFIVLILAWLMPPCLGACVGDGCAARGASRASLMQVASKQKSAHVVLLEASEHLQHGDTAAALSGFQKFTDEMVAKYAQQPVDNTTKAAIQTIIDYMDTLFGYLVEWHNLDKARADKCEDNIDRCEDDHFSTSTVSFLNQFYTKVNTSRHEHLTCRTDCEVTCTTQNTACQNYDAYRLTSPALLPECVDDPLEELCNDCISTTDTDILADMETCLNATKTWHKPLYDLYKACYRGGPQDPCTLCKEECKREQGEFEVEHCQWSTLRVDHCHAHHICWNHSVQQCNYDCTEIQNNVEARKAQNETGERIECLLYVLMADNESKAGDLDDCKKKEYNTSFFNLSCHEGDNSAWPPSYPELPISCDTSEVPCTDDFIDAEYSTVIEDTCRVCDTLKTPFYFLQDGQCGGATQLAFVHKKSIGACAAACHEQDGCGHFSWAAVAGVEEGVVNCALFPEVLTPGGCLEDASPYITYSLQPTQACAWAKPHPGEFDKVLCEDGTFIPTSPGCGDVEPIQCPINVPFMCADKSCSADSACEGADGPRPCGQAALGAK